MFTLFNAFMKGYTSKSNISVQEANQSELSELANIHAVSFKHAWSDGELEKMLGTKNYFCMVAHVSGLSKTKPAGFVLIRSTIDEAEVITIATDPAYRKKGIGQKLMQEAIRKLEFDRIEKLILEVDETNEAAINLYNNLYFKQIGEREGYYSTSNSDETKRSKALVMQRDLV